MRAAMLPLLVCVLLAGCAQEPAAPQGAAPEWSFVDTEGATHTRDAPPGNATVIFFMATWCPTCRATTPVLADAHAAHGGEGVRFYSVTFDASDDAASLEEWKARHEQPWPHGVDPSFHIQRAFGITAQSSVVVLDGDGRLVQRWGYGSVTADALRAAIETALRPTSPA